MKLKYIVAVEHKNLTEQDEVRLYDMDGKTLELNQKITRL